MIPDPTQTHPMPGVDRVVFLRPLISSDKIVVGEYTYYDDPVEPAAFEQRNVLYGYGPEKLVIGRYCAIAEGTRFIMSGAMHPMVGPSTFPFAIFGGSWRDETLDLVMNVASRGDTVVGNDVWFGYQSLIMPGVTIGDGAIIAAGSVVVSDVPPYAIVGGNPATVIRMRYEPEDVRRLLAAAWWNWPVELVTEHARLIMSGTPADLEAIAADK
ncbi:antibiotic acetyltransferase [Pseudonocardiaceae bacterium YIM PH 21723]|nr:antibiotic acetyltransferase [Pseudonocardiaceae bacterium YIM PH 21723]